MSIPNVVLATWILSGLWTIFRWLIPLVWHSCFINLSFRCHLINCLTSQFSCSSVINQNMSTCQLFPAYCHLRHQFSASISRSITSPVQCNLHYYISFLFIRHCQSDLSIIVSGIMRPCQVVFLMVECVDCNFDAQFCTLPFFPSICPASTTFINCFSIFTSIINCWRLVQQSELTTIKCFGELSLHLNKLLH